MEASDNTKDSSSGAKTAKKRGNGAVLDDKNVNKSTANKNKRSKNHKNGTNASTSSSTPSLTPRQALHQEIGFQSMSLQDIRARLEALCKKVPKLPNNGTGFTPVKTEEESKQETNELTKEESEAKSAGTQKESTQPILPSSNSNDGQHHSNQFAQPRLVCPYDMTQIRAWATALQHCLEEFYLLTTLVSPATYLWASERSGAAEQALGTLSNEFVRSQEQISGRVAVRLNDVLAPVVTLVTAKTVTEQCHQSGDASSNEEIKTNGAATTNGERTTTANPPNTTSEIKRNYFVTTLEDPDYVHLGYTTLARNAPLLRQIVLANFDKLLTAVDDYLQACAQDSQHDARGFHY